MTACSAAESRYSKQRGPQNKLSNLSLQCHKIYENGDKIVPKVIKTIQNNVPDWGSGARFGGLGPKMEPRMPKCLIFAPKKGVPNANQN